MEKEFTLTQLTLLMNENSLTALNKTNIINKIHKLLEFMNYLNTKPQIDLSEIYTSVVKEQKLTAKAIVLKNNKLSKNLIKSMASQKENLLQAIEISQLRLEAELKSLNKKISYPTVKTNVSAFSKIFELLKIPFKNIKSIKTPNTNTSNIRKKIKITTLKLNELEEQKENLSKKIAYTGEQALKHLNKTTYNLFLPSSDTSIEKLETIKNKISIFKS